MRGSLTQIVALVAGAGRVAPKPYERRTTRCDSGWSARNHRLASRRVWLNFATKYEKQEDSSLLAGGDVKPGAVTHVWVETTLSNITGFRLEALTHPNLPYGGPGRAFNGTCALSDFLVEAADLKNPTNKVKVKWSDATADFNAPEAH